MSANIQTMIFLRIFWSTKAKHINICKTIMCKR